jgi:hypothetical protein
MRSAQDDKLLNSIFKNDIFERDSGQVSSGAAPPARVLGALNDMKMAADERYRVVFSRDT